LTLRRYPLSWGGRSRPVLRPQLFRRPVCSPGANCPSNTRRIPVSNATKGHAQPLLGHALSVQRE
jgi:hypothetical protein